MYSEGEEDADAMQNEDMLYIGAYAVHACLLLGILLHAWSGNPQQYE